MLYLTGKNANFLRRGANSAGTAWVTCNPTASTVGPLANVYDDDPSTPYINGSNVANPWIKVDVNAIRSGDFEHATAVDGYLTEGGNAGDRWWSAVSGTGTAARTTTAGQFETGTAGLALNGGTGYGLVSEYYRVQAGESREISLRYKTSTASSVKVEIRNKHTGLYLHSDLTWVAAQAYCWNSVTADGTWRSATVAYTVESLALCGGDEAVLSVTIINTVSGASYIDTVVDVPGVNFLSIHGHNIAGAWASGKSQTPQVLQWSTDDSSWTNVSYVTKYAGSFYYTFSTLYKRWWRLYWDGTNRETMWIGEMVLGQARTCATSPLYAGSSFDAQIPGVRSQGPQGRVMNYRMAMNAALGADLKFLAASRATLDELIEGIWQRSGQGRYPVVMVPDTNKPDVIFGRTIDPVRYTPTSATAYDAALRFVPDLLPTVGL